MMKTNYEEGPWVFRRGDIYYLVYAAGGVPEHMAYSYSRNINGPWIYAAASSTNPRTASPSMAEA